MTVDLSSAGLSSAGLSSAPVSEEEITLFRASFAQQRMWFLSKLDPGNPLYNVPIILQFDGPVRPDVLQSALAEIVSRHEILRTTFVEVDGELMQAVAQSAEVTVPVTEIEPQPGQTLPPTQRPDVRAAVVELVKAPFDLGAGPLLRARLLDLRDGTRLFVLAMHHIIVDGWSIGVLCEELRALYQAKAAGVPAALPPVRLHMGDIAEEERDRASGPAYAQHLAYWKAQLAGELTAPELPFDRDRPSHTTSRGASLDFALSSAQMAAMAAFGREMDVTAFMTLLAVFYTLLHRYNGSCDQVVGAPMANREDSRTAGMIGLFVNTIPLRATIDPDASFAALLASVREMTLGAYEHQEMPLEQIVDEVAPERLPGRNPLVAVLFAMQSPPPADLDFAGTSASFAGMPTEATRADLELHFWPRRDHIAAQFVYSTELFDAATVERIRDDYLALLHSAVTSPHVPIRRLPMGTEQAPLVQNLAPLLEHDEHSAAITGGGGGDIAHAELRETAAALAEALPDARGSVVALGLERGPDLVAALVAAVSAGAQRVVWLPPSQPAPYRERALREWAPSVVVDDARVAGARSAGSSAPLRTDAAIGLLDTSLAEMLVALLHSGRVDLDHPAPVGRTVLTADHRFAPPGVLGELCVGRPDAGVLATGVPARIRRDSSVEIARAPRGIAWDGCSWADLSTVEAVLLGNPVADDCAVLARRASSGAVELVAYVATSAPVSAQRLSEFARAALPAPLVPRAFVLVAALPTTSTGELDIAALCRLPVIDDELVAQWSAQLPEAARVQSVPDIPETPQIRVGDPPARRVPARAAEPRADEPSVLDGGPAVAPTVPTLPDALVRAAQEAATTALVFLDETGDERSLTYAALLDAARRVLGGLRAAGLAPGDLAIVHLTRNDDFTAAIWGCFLGGFVPVPVAANTAGGADKTAEAWTALGQPLVIGEFAHPSARAARIGDLLAHDPDAEHHRPDPDALALLLLTSGSTGTPKGVQLTHRNILTRSAATARMHGFGPADISFNWMPLEHVGGVVMSHLHDVHACCQQVHAATSWVLADPLRWLAVADRHRVTTTWAPNFAFGLIADRVAEAAEPGQFDLTPLRFILNGGEAIVPRTARRFLRVMEQFGLPQTAMRPSWGMSETSSGVLYSETFSLETTTDADQFTELAQPLPGVRMRIVDADDAVVPVGTVGRVQISGPTVTRGYYADAERTAEAFTADGWFDTGDLGRMQHGALTLTGRAKDVIIVHGVNYTCHEVESAVEESPFVMRSYSAAVAVRPEGSDTDALAIVFSPRPGAAEDEVFADIRERVLAVGPNPDFLIPVPPESIPKTDIGKIQRTLLRERFAAGEFDHVVRGQGSGAAGANTMPNWFFQPVWRRRERSRRSAVVEGGVLLTGQPGELGAQLADQLRGRGVPTARADAKDIAAGFDWSVGATAIRAVVCFVGDRSEHEHADQVLPASVFEVARVVQGLSGESQPPALHVVGSGTQAVTAADEVQSGLAAIPALLRSAVAETPGLRARFIDLDPEDPARGAQHVAGELAEAANDMEVAYRGGVRWTKGLERLGHEPAAPADIAPGSLHLISGGLGGLAHELAQLLVERFQARVLLVGRRDPAPGQLAAHRRLSESAGYEAVRHAVADICDVGHVWNAVAHTEHDWGAQLSGIWHLAGAYREQPMAVATEAELVDVAKAKIAGVRALHQIAERRPGVRFVSFSSVNGFFGGAGVGGYSAANAYLDAFARYQRRSCGVAAQSIAWTMWDHVGMSAHVEHPELTRARGYHVLGRSDGLRSLLVALAHGAPHVLVGLNEAKPMIRAHLGAVAPTKHMLVADVPEAAPHVAGALVQDRYGCVVPTRVESANAAREWVAARDDTERRLSAVWQQVLGSDDFSVTDSFFEIGGNSVLLALAHRLVQEEFGRSIALVDLFRYPTVSALAAYLSDTGAASEPGEPKSDFGSDRARIRKEARRRARPNRA